MRFLDRPEQSCPNPVVRVAITSEWSPKIERACVATVRAATWKTAAVSSPAILNMLGIMRRRPWEAVNVVVNAPAWSAPCTARGAGFALHLLDHGDRAPEVSEPLAPPHASAELRQLWRRV